MTSPSTPFREDHESETEADRRASRMERIKQRTIELGLYTEYWDSPETDPEDGTNPAA